MSKHTKLETYFNQLLTLEEKSRTVFLQELRDNEPEIYQELLALYGQHAEASQYFARIEEKISDTLFEKEDISGETFGNYQLEELIGSGGMANVYKAKRIDGTFQREAAIKFTKRGLDSENVLARFQYERKILGRLKHESIAQIYDAGMTEEGLPYFVMEYVDGTDIISYAKEKNLNIRHRLNLFQQVCKAVEFAHKNLVIHRDIKPTNILIDWEEKVKLTDFGIAKILNPEEDSELTQLHSQVMTPSYASPEQRKGDFINTTSDVFQLGLLLYELVSGEKAYDKEKKEYQFNFDKKLVPSEIKSIIQTATREEPEERYNTAEALLQDINNFLGNRPVKARGNHAGYVFKKFVARNKLLFTFMAILAAGLVSGILIISIEKSNAEKAAIRAQEQNARAQATSDYLINTFLQANPIYSDGDTMNIFEVLEIGEKNIINLEKNPAIQANLYNTLGTIYFDLNSFAKADTLIDKSISIYKSKQDSQLKLADPYFNKGLLKYHYKSDYDSAIFYFMEAKKLWEETPTEKAENIAEVNTALSNCFRMKNKFEMANEYLRESNQWLLKLNNKGKELSQNYIILGQINRDLKQYETAINEQRKALIVLDTLSDKLPVHEMVCYGEIATAYLELNEQDSALIYRKRNLEMARKIFGEKSAHVSTSLNNLALIYKDLEMYDSAIYYLDRSYEIHAQVYLNKGHFAFAVYHQNMGSVLLKQKEYEKAEIHLLKSMQLRKDLFDYPNQELAATHKSLGDLYYQTDRYSAAHEHYQKAYDINLELYGPDDDKTKRYFKKLQKLDSLTKITTNI